ncbi:copper amine oxidase N-terminal domain-containing protein [Natranaerofaba carboxydovora]|uniref:copper amine oxidase N-terminal domain-containing protein n=1 Tax=Natranaerofaba carboxydovora TaxID=2742683 RepID=UPI001F147AB7|nr:copper amine oxidase N-terminal domain-containing protein [Natranaerofaba carboxydovora]
MVLVLTFLLPSAFAEDTKENLEVLYNNITIYVDGEKQNTEQEPFIHEGRTFVPLRFVSDALGEHLEWDGTEQNIYIGKRPGDEKEYLEGKEWEEYYDPSGSHLRFTAENNMTSENIVFSTIDITCIDEEELYYGADSILSISEKYPEYLPEPPNYGNYLLIRDLEGRDDGHYYLLGFNDGPDHGYISSEEDHIDKYGTSWSNGSQYGIENAEDYDLFYIPKGSDATFYRIPTE